MVSNSLPEQICILYGVTEEKFLAVSRHYNDKDSKAIRLLLNNILPLSIFRFQIFLCQSKSPFKSWAVLVFVLNSLGYRELASPLAWCLTWFCLTRSNISLVEVQQSDQRLPWWYIPRSLWVEGTCEVEARTTWQTRCQAAKALILQKAITSRAITATPLS